MRIRAEREADRARVFQVEQAAFGREQEARLVDSLREQADPQISLVAERDGSVVGHVFFTPLTLRTSGSSRRPGALGALGPLAVDPSCQGMGIGSALVRAGLARCGEVGWRAVLLLGNPAYYARFGFELAAPRGIHYRGFDAAFQLLELEAGALDGCTGEACYLPGFDDV